MDKLKKTIKLQNLCRMFLARKILKKLIKEKNAIFLQKHLRKLLAKLYFIKLKKNKSCKKIEKFYYF